MNKTYGRFKKLSANENFYSFRPLLMTRLTAFLISHFHIDALFLNRKYEIAIEVGFFFPMRWILKFQFLVSKNIAELEQLRQKALRRNAQMSLDLILNDWWLKLKAIQVCRQL